MPIKTGPQKPAREPRRAKRMPIAPAIVTRLVVTSSNYEPSPFAIGPQAARVAANIEPVASEHFQDAHQDVEGTAASAQRSRERRIALLRLSTMFSMTEFSDRDARSANRSSKVG